MVRTLGTGKSLFGVDSTLVGAKMTCSVKGHMTFPAGSRIKLLTKKRFLLQVTRHDMLLKRRVFAKCLIARGVLCAAIFVPSIVSGQMSTQTRASHKALSAAGAIAYIVSNSGMGALDMMVQMRGTQERLVAIWLGAGE